MPLPKLVVRAALILTILCMVKAEYVIYLLDRDATGDDFFAYYTAACMVRDHQGPLIYEQAYRSADPIAEWPTPDTVFVHVAGAHGILFPPYYDYPPTLADMLVPFTCLSPPVALHIWWILNALAMIWASFLLARIPATPVAGRFLFVFAFLCTFPPTVDCLTWAQAPILLLVLLMAGIGLYLREKTYSAALLFALAAAIKLTPLVVAIPLLMWRDGKTLRALALWGAAIACALLAINGWATLHLYFFHEMPRLATKWIVAENRTLDNVVEALGTGSITGAPRAATVWLGRLLSFLVLCCAGWMSRLKRGEMLDGAAKAETFAVFLLLSCCVAPVSWLHAYVLGVPILAMLGRRMWENRLPQSETVVALLFVLSLTTYRIQYERLITPLLGIALCFLALLRLKRERTGPVMPPDSSLQLEDSPA